MPYADETALETGAMDIMARFPWMVGVPVIQDLIDKLFPRPLIPIMPGWPGWVLDKWNQFADLFKTKFTEMAGEEIEDEEAAKAIVVAAAEYAATELDFDLWDTTDGLPSMPVYEAPVEEPG
jgi:hypothetical protein